MSGRVAVIYTGELEATANLFAEAASHVATHVRTARLGDSDNSTSSTPNPDISMLEWADGIAFGTPSCPGHPAKALMDYLERSERLWRSGRLYDKVVTVFTDQPQRMAADSILHPIYDALYRWGAVIVGPRDVDLPTESQVGTTQGEPGLRERAARYRAYRLSRLASVIAEDRIRKGSLQL